MKAKYITLAVFILIVIPSYVISQTVGVEENMFKKTFTSKKLNTFQLNGFETRAIQKVKDYGDYLSLIANKQYDLELRKKAVQMVQEFFVNEKVLIKNPEKEILTTKTAEINKYAQALLESSYSKVETGLTQITLKKPVSLSKKGDYVGTISFTQTNKYYKDKKHVKNSTAKRNIAVIVKKTFKKFGNKKEQVWSVYLGEISSK